MLGRFLVIFLSILPALARAQIPAIGQQELLLQRHADARIAHVMGDADLMVGDFATPLLSLARGALRTDSPEKARTRFSGYFRQSRFLEWDDIRPPRFFFSADSTQATKLVTKRVRLLTSQPDGSVAEEAVDYAWLEVWRQIGGTWQLALVASTDSTRSTPAADIKARLEAFETLQRSREAMGGAAALARVSMLEFVATGQGPRRNSLTHVRSARDGRASMLQRFADSTYSEFGINTAGAWRRSSQTGGRVDSLALADRAFLHGHEVHMLVAAPESRWSNAKAVGKVACRTGSCDAVQFLDGTGGKVEMRYDRESGLPVQAILPVGLDPQAARVSIVFEDWRAVGGIRLPFRVEFEHADDRFVYRIERAGAGWLTEEAFLP